MRRIRTFFTQRLSVKFGLTVGAFGLIAIVLFAGVISIVQSQTRASASLQLTLESTIIGERLVQNALRLHYQDGAVRTMIVDDMAVFDSNVNTLRTGDISRNISAPSAQMSMTLDGAMVAWQSVATGLNQLLQDPQDSAALETITSNYALLETQWAQVALLHEAGVEQAGSSLLTFIPLIGITSILVFAILLLIIRRVLKQVDSITTVFDAVGRGNYGERATPSSNDELGTMAVSLNSMLDSTLALIQSQSERDQLQNSIMKLLDEVADVADGDLTVEAEVTTEITGAIADSFNYMILQLRDVIGNVQSTTRIVGLSASEVQESTESLAKLSELQSQRIAATSDEISSMAAEIRNVSQRASRSAAVGAQARNTAIEGSEAVADTIQGMERIRNQVLETSKRIKRLGESSQEIGEIVQLIGDIADRTSILALNASIQAAMAGDAGKGFGVVAQEVEQLAERATESTRRIETLVKAIQSETKEAVTAMESTTSEVVHGSELAVQAGQSLENIEAVSTELADLISSISSDTQRQAHESEEIATSIGEISELIRENAEGTQKTAQTINNMAQQTEQLRASLETFKLPAISVNGYS